MESISFIFDNLFGILTFFYFYFLVCMIASIVSLWKIFKKENIPAFYSLIPFLNIYKYFKICGLPFWTIFVPVVNIITLYCSPYIIVKKYRCKRWQAILAIFLPFVFLPYIAFSNKRNIDFVYDNMYVKNNNDIDKLEKNLEKNYYDEFDSLNKNEKEIANVENINNTIIDNIESNIMLDEYVYDDVDEVYEQKEQLEELPTSNDNFVEIVDDVDINNLSLENMDILEENIKTENSVEKNIIKDEKEYQEVAPTQEAIAFGGEKKIENIDSKQTKNDELKCSRCGSSLVGANGYCPGCGIKI